MLQNKHVFYYVTSIASTLVASASTDDQVLHQVFFFFFVTLNPFWSLKRRERKVQFPTVSIRMVNSAYNMILF